MNTLNLLVFKTQNTYLFNQTKTKAMKKTLLALVIPVMLLAAACNQGKEEISKLKTTNDSLVSISRAKDSMVNDFVSSFNAIQSNLDSIKMKEKIISNTTSGSSELKTRSKDQINSDINQIYRMQVENKAMLATLRSKLKTSGVKIDQLQTMIDNLDKQIESKDVEIAQLKDDLTKLNVQVTDLNTKVTDLNTNVETLNAVNKEKEEVIQNKTAELNTAYYVIGTTSYLKEKKIVTKEGGFIGLGKSKELTPDIDKSALTKVDITQLSAIPIMKSKVTLLTTHPKNSYRLTGKNMADSLVITNPKEFWSISKVLVLNVK